jgi:hypothetical protein
MRRIKAHIVTYIPAEAPTDRLYQICETAEHWSDEIIVSYCHEYWDDRAGSHVPSGTATYGIHKSSWNRREAFSMVERKAGIRSTRPCVIVSLESTWLPSDPHIIRDAVELNTGKVLYAPRYFMVDSRGYRADGIFAPIKVCPIFPFMPGAHFNSEMDTAPAYAWNYQYQGEAPFSILDMAMYGDEEFAAAGTTRMFEGTIAV